MTNKLHTTDNVFGQITRDVFRVLLIRFDWLFAMPKYENQLYEKKKNKTLSKLLQAFPVHLFVVGQFD